MSLHNGLLIADVAHRRPQPRENTFRYSVYYLCFPLSRMNELSLPCLSVDKPNLFSYRQRDHGDPARGNESWIHGVLQEWGLKAVTDGEITLLTMPRLFGYVFNPVSFWFCHDRKEQLRAVLCEVRNTFGERHCYLCYHDDHRPIAPDDWLTSQKVFHVSPFMEITGEYRYRFDLRDGRVGVWINHVTSDGDMLYTSLTGRRVPLTSTRLMGCFLRYPLVTFKVITLIHWQALKLISKGVRYRRKPAPPEEEITR